GSSKNGQIRCEGMNFDTPTSSLRVSVDVIATVVFGSLGHSTTDSFPLKSNVPADNQFWEGGNKHRSDQLVGPGGYRNRPRRSLELTQSGQSQGWESGETLIS